MAGRKAMKNRRKDRAIFKRTAARTEVHNVPGRVLRRGGTVL